MAENFNVTSDDHTTSITINSSLDMNSAEQLLDVMKQAGESDLDIEVDASQVEAVSTACYQILLATNLSAQKKGHRFDIKKSSEKFVAGLSELGLRDMFKKAE